MLYVLSYVSFVVHAVFLTDFFLFTVSFFLFWHKLSWLQCGSSCPTAIAMLVESVRIVRRYELFGRSRDYQLTNTTRTTRTTRTVSQHISRSKQDQELTNSRRVNYILYKNYEKNLRGNLPIHFECITLTTRSNSRLKIGVLLRWFFEKLLL